LFIPTTLPAQMNPIFWQRLNTGTVFHQRIQKRTFTVFSSIPKKVIDLACL